MEYVKDEIKGAIGTLFSTKNVSHIKLKFYHLYLKFLSYFFFEYESLDLLQNSAKDEINFVLDAFGDSDFK